MEKRKMAQDLKTLKDLQWSGDLDTFWGEEPIQWIIKQELKAEAVKWERFIYLQNYEITAKQFIMDFFNLTEEDLK